MVCDCGCGVELKEGDDIRIALEGKVEKRLVWPNGVTEIVPMVNPYALAKHILLEHFNEKMSRPSKSKAELLDELKQAMTDLHRTHPAILQEIYVYTHRVLGCRI